MNTHERRSGLLFLLGAVGVFWSAAALADSMADFGVQYNSLGNATLSSTASGGVQVSNIGSTGSDGVQLMPLSGASPWATNFYLDTSIDTGSAPVGSYYEETNYGPISGGTAPVVSSLTVTQQSDGVTLSADFPDSPSGQLITIDYYSGGPDGTLVHTETTGQTGFGITVRKAGGYEPDTTQSDWNYYNWPNVCTQAYDSFSSFGDVTTVGGTVLPETDDIDFIHMIAQTNLPMEPASLDDSSITITGGGGLTSFAITGEALMVPEPASIVLALLAGFALAGWAFARQWPYAAKD
jgi:hypothetical protein